MSRDRSDMTERLRETAAPRWLIEVVRPRPATPPWSSMIRSGVAITVPIAVGLVTGALPVALPAAMGALGSVTADRGGPYRARALRLACTAPAATFGLVCGMLAHGHHVFMVIALTGLAALSAALSVTGNTGSVAGLQLLLFASLGTGPLAMIKPLWLPPVLFLTGAAWTLALSVLGWAVFPRLPERRVVADAYRALARVLRAVGTDAVRLRREELTTALNNAYDELLRARSTDAGPDAARSRLIALLNQTNLLAEATLAFVREGRRLGSELPRTVEAIANAIGYDREPPPIPEAIRDSPASRAMHSALTGVAELLSGRAVTKREARLPARSRRDRLSDVLATLRGGRLFRLHAVRLTMCMAAAGVVAEVLPLARSYWVPLTVAIVLKPDFGSVFARAMQRGIGTVVGVGIGAIILVIVPYGPLILLPMLVLAGLMPMGMRHNYGLFTTFNAPLVILLVDLLTHTGWPLVWDRLADTLLGCAIVIIVGYAPWPTSWHARVGPQIADAIRLTARYLEAALAGEHAAGSRLRRATYRSLSDARVSAQRAIAEPQAVSRRVTAWWPVVVALERVADAIAAEAVRIEHGVPPPVPAEVRTLTDALGKVADAVDGGEAPGPPSLPDDDELSDLTDAVHAFHAVFVGPGGDLAQRQLPTRRFGR